MFKIRERVIDADTLCATCARGTVVQTRNGDVTAYCAAAGLDGCRVPQGIVRCTSYRDKRHTSQFELEKIAWTLNPNRSNRAGFTPPSKDEPRFPYFDTE